jgi:hypothetical protein
LVVEKKFPIRYDTITDDDPMASEVDPNPGIEPLDIDCQSMPAMLTDDGRWLHDAADITRCGRRWPMDWLIPRLIHRFGTVANLFWIHFCLIFVSFLSHFCLIFQLFVGWQPCQTDSQQRN